MRDFVDKLICNSTPEQEWVPFTPDNENPIESFKAITVAPLRLRLLTSSRVKLGGQFIVRIKFTNLMDCSRFEYRQYIYGNASVQRGRFRGIPSLETWEANGPIQNANNVFPLIGGLSTRLKEDVDSKGQRYGYRDNPPLVKTGIEDRYLPTQEHGCTYRSRDSYGLQADRIIGLRIRLSLHFQGRIIDKHDNNRIVATRHWGVNGDDIIDR